MYCVDNNMNDQGKMISDGHSVQHDDEVYAVGNGYYVPSTSRDNDAKISSRDNSNDITDSIHHSSDVLQSASGSENYVSKKIEAPTSKNIASLDNNQSSSDVDIPYNINLDDDKIQPPCIDATNNNNMQRGRQRQPRIKDHGYVPQFVHIPNTTANDNANFDATKRAPSVPDLISYSHEGNIAESNNTDTNLLLSNKTLRYKDQESRKEQLEERLKRAHLRLNSDTDLSETRYRSKSTPSRGGGMQLPSLSDRQRFAGLYIGNTGLVTHADESTGINGESSTSLIHANVSQLETSNLAQMNVSSQPLIVEGISPLQKQHADTPNSVVTNASVKSSHGSHCSRTLLSDASVERDENVLEPPPPPPPATEKERLVERERQARLETERARRRQALLRERELEELEEENVVESEGSDDNVALLGQVSFDAELAQDAQHSSAGSSSVSIPRPPLPPPPATERERLVERERQARLETERARRRQALLRERELEELEEESVSSDNNVDLQREGNNFETNGVVTSLPQTAEGDNTIEIIPCQGEVLEAEASLSYPMERFLERVDDEEPSMIPVDTSAMENDATTALPYTMELFLADNADSTSVSQTHQPISAEPLIDSPGPIQLDLDFEANQNELLDADLNETSVASVNASITDAENSQTNHTNRQSHQNLRAEQSDSSPSRLSTASSHDSFDVNPSTHLTEADIAQLAEVEHASTQGNAAPHSLRDEPSEASVVGRGVFLGDNAFSVATQTTMMVESVTEASEGRPFSGINENESLEVIRVAGSGISIQTGSSVGPSSESLVEEIPSRASSHVGGENASYSLGHDSIGMPRLTEAGIGTMVDIDQASIAGNAPPQSIRDERLSESSIAERGGHNQFRTTPITEISSVDENDLLMMDNSNDHDSLSNQQPENASVEAMPSEHSDQSDILHDPEEEDTIVYQASNTCSSASIEALPSIDLENESATHHYGAIDAGNVSHYSAESLSEDIESAPLLSARREGRAMQGSNNLDSLASIEEGREKSDEPFASLVASSALIVAEIPTFIVIAQRNDQLYSLLEVERYHIVMASIVVMTSILNQSAIDKPISIEGAPFNKLLWPYVLDELLQKGILLGFFIGLLCFVLSNLDIWFSVVALLSTALATIISRLCKVCFAWLLRKLINPSHIQRFAWIEVSVMAGLQDCVRCLVYFNSLSLLMAAA